MEFITLTIRLSDGSEPSGPHAVLNRLNNCLTVDMQLVASWLLALLASY